MRSYQVIKIQSPYDYIGDPVTQAFLPKIAEFKINGYLEEYPYGVLPLDSSDFLATHLLIIDQFSKKILVGMKSITLDKCLSHHIQFPMLGMLRSLDDTTHHQNKIQNIMNHFLHENKTNKLSYNGSYTVCPEVRKNKFEMKIIWEMSQSLMINHYLDEKAEQVVAICSKQFKIDEVKKKLGWDYLYFQDKILEEYRCLTLNNTLFLPMTVTRHSQFALELADKYKHLWENRLEPQTLIKHKKVA